MDYFYIPRDSLRWGVSRSQKTVGSIKICLCKKRKNSSREENFQGECRFNYISSNKIINKICRLLP